MFKSWSKKTNYQEKNFLNNWEELNMIWALDGIKNYCKYF